MEIKKVLGVIFLVVISMVFVACSKDGADTKDGSSEEQKEVINEETEQEETGKTEETTEVTEEEPLLPEDEELFDVIEVNFQTIVDKDLNGHINTLHSESPYIEATIDAFNLVKSNDVTGEISDLIVESKSETEARVKYKQTTIISGTDFKDNEIIGIHILKPDDGEWKIYATEVIETVYLEEQNDSNVNADPNNLFSMVEGQHLHHLEALELPYANKAIYFQDYRENGSFSVAELIMEHNRYGKVLVRLEYSKSSALSPEQWGINTEEAIAQKVDGALEFNVLSLSHTEALYEFTLEGDSSLSDQAEVIRVFLKGEDLFIVSYTIFGESSIDDAVKNEWLEEMKTIK